MIVDVFPEKAKPIVSMHGVYLYVSSKLSIHVGKYTIQGMVFQ